MELEEWKIYKKELDDIFLRWGREKLGIKFGSMKDVKQQREKDVVWRR